MPLRLAFDLDGVLADMESELVRQAEALFGEPMTRRLQHPREDAEPPLKDTELAVPEPTPPLLRLNMTTRQQRRLWRHVESVESFWETLREIEPGSVAKLYRLATSRRWEVIFLTRRPQTAGATAQVQTQRWLEAKGFRLPSVFVVQGSRGRIAASLALDIVVDDRPENCLDVVVDSKARAILVWRQDKKDLPPAARRLGIGVVRSVAECLDVLARLDTGSDRAGMIHRFRRLLGLNEPVRA